MAKLSGRAINEAIQLGDIVINPYVDKHMGPNSYDLTLAPTLKVYKKQPDYHHGAQPLDVTKKNPTREIHIPESGHVLEPGRLYLAHTNEIAGSTKFVPCIEGRSSMARLGVQVHLTAGFGDVGFVGQWTLEMAVVEPVLIKPHIRICQIYFDTLQLGIYETAPKLYDGKYNRSKGVNASQSWKDYEHGKTEG